MLTTHDLENAEQPQTMVLLSIIIKQPYADLNQRHRAVYVMNTAGRKYVPERMKIYFGM